MLPSNPDQSRLLCFTAGDEFISRGLNSRESVFGLPSNPDQSQLFCFTAGDEFRSRWSTLGKLILQLSLTFRASRKARFGFDTRLVSL